MKQAKSTPVPFRWYMAGILFTTGISILLFNKGLSEAGLDMMLLRFPMAVILGYGAFVLAVRAWLLDCLEGEAELPRIFPGIILDLSDVRDLGETAAGFAGLSILGDGNSPSNIIPGSPLRSLGLFSGSLVFLSTVVVYLLYHAPRILGKTMHGLILSRLRRSPFLWVRILFRLTWKPFAIAVLLAFCLGSFASILDSQILPGNYGKTSLLAMVPYYRLLTLIPEWWMEGRKAIQEFHAWTSNPFGKWFAEIQRRDKQTYERNSNTGDPGYGQRNGYKNPNNYIYSPQPAEMYDYSNLANEKVTPWIIPTPQLIQISGKAPGEYRMSFVTPQGKEILSMEKGQGNKSLGVWVRTQKKN